MKRSCIYVSAGILLLAGITVGIALNRNPHDFIGQCDICHLVAPQSGQKGIFIQDIDYLCMECHRVSKSNSHPSEIAPSMKMPSGFSLDWQGRITCTTCHDPHVEDLSSNPAMLRGQVGGKEFCIQCHQDYFTAPEKHLAASGTAHTKSWTPPDKEALNQILDAASLECLACHEGSVATAVSYQLGGMESLTFQGRSLSHPVGVDYASAASANRQLRSLNDLSPQISLYEGKVGCTSCHNPFSSETDMLVFNNRGSALCLECHLK